MKVKLERSLTHCPKPLKCKVCHQIFDVSKLRTLLYSDRGLLIGDMCSYCLKRKAPEIQHLLKRQGNYLLAPLPGKKAQTITSYQQALELLEISAENIEFPTFYQHWLKHIQIFVQETQELEAARFRLSRRTVEQRSRLEKTFEYDVE